MEGDYITEIHLDNKLDCREFEVAIASQFPGSKVDFQKLPPDAIPGYQLLYVHVPLKHKEEIMPFIDEYARMHGAYNHKSINLSFPFNPAS